MKRFILAAMILAFMAMPVMAEQGVLKVGVIRTNGEVDLDNAEVIAGININDGMFQGEVDFTSNSNVLEMDRTGIYLEYGLTDNFSISGSLGVQAATTSGLIEIAPGFPAIGYETDTENGLYWQAGAKYEYPLDCGITPFITADYSRGKNDIEGITLSALGLAVTLPDAINQVGGLFSPDISSGISGDITVNKIKGIVGLKKDFEYKKVTITPFIGASYLWLYVDTDVVVSATDGYNNIDLSFQAENKSDLAYGGVAGVELNSGDFLSSKIELSFINERNAAVIGSLCFKF